MSLRVGRSVLFVFAGLALVLSLAAPVRAQVENATITGVVTDPTDAVIPGADVMATNLGTGLVRTAQTTRTGIYTIAELPVGAYKIEVTATGFRTAVRSRMTLNAGTTHRVDFRMELGERAEVIEVTGGVPLVNTVDSRPSITVGDALVANLPLNGRNVYDLIQLAPGAVNVAGVSFENGEGTVVNGLRPNFNGFLINGVSNKGLSGGSVTIPNPDIVQEFQMLTMNMSAQYGNSAAAITNLVTKSGTNDFHGSVYHFIRNDALDATEFFRNKEGVEISPLRFNQFGATATGRIIRDKLFFTGSYQGERFKTQAPAVPIVVETPEWRSAIGAAFGADSVAARLYQDFAPSVPGSPLQTLREYVEGGAGGFGAVGFWQYMCPDMVGNLGVTTQLQNLMGVTAGDVGSMADESAIYQAGPDGVLGTPDDNSFTPTMTLTGFTNAGPDGIIGTADDAQTANCGTYAGGGPALRGNLLGALGRDIPFFNSSVAVFPIQSAGNLFDGDEWSTRIDWVGEKDRIFGEFYWQDATDAFGPANNSSGPRGFKNPQDGHSPNFQFSWVRTFSPTVLNELKLGFTRDKLFLDVALPGVPSIGFDDGSAGFGSYNGYPQFFIENIYTYSDMVSITKGSHNIKIGGELRRNYENSEFNVARPSYYFFDQVFFAVDAPYVIVAGVDPGIVSGQPAELSSNIRAWRNWEIGAYIQDDWKVSRNLTLNLGLRYDNYRRHTEKFGKETTFIKGPISAAFDPTNPLTHPTVQALLNANVPRGTPGCSTATGQNEALAQLAGECGPGGFAPIADAGLSALGGQDNNNFGPRVGVAWDPLGKGKTAIRGGFGVSYEGTLYNPLSNSRWNLPFYSFNLIFNDLLGDPDCVIYGPTGDPTGLPAGTCAARTAAAVDYTGPATNTGAGAPPQGTGNIVGYDPRSPNLGFLTGIVFPEGIKDPIIYNWYAGIQQEILPNTVLEVSYVATRGQNLFRAQQVNRAPGTRIPQTATPGPDGILGTADDVFVPTVVNVQGRTLTGLGQRRLNPNYGVMRAWFNTTDSWYHSLQASVRKRMSRGIMFDANYTWGHSLDTGSGWHSGAVTANGAAAGDGYSLDQTLPELDKGNSTFDIRQRFVVSGVWELPWHKEQHGAAGHILGGWQWNGSLSAQSGAHWTAYDARAGTGFDYNRDGENNDRPDAPNGNNIAATKDMYANGYFPLGGFASALNFFTTPCAGCNGSLGRNTFEGPGQITLSTSVFKNIAVTEQVRVQFRAEFFNAFNRANFLLPSSSTGANFANRINSPIFGASAGTLDPRQIQFGLKILW